ncbi:MAG: transcriptional regulatory, partial [Desulfobacterales bacterium]|nr:transcriptional regulatory [Desulfobacterales bacterium]
QPLQVISGYTDIILYNISKDDKIYEKLKLIKEQTYKMSQITKKLMSITRYETKNYTKGKKIIDLDKSSQ